MGMYIWQFICMYEEHTCMQMHLCRCICWLIFLHYIYLRPFILLFIATTAIMTTTTTTAAITTTTSVMTIDLISTTTMSTSDLTTTTMIRAPKDSTPSAGTSGKTMCVHNVHIIIIM